MKITSDWEMLDFGECNMVYKSPDRNPSDNRYYVLKVPTSFDEVSSPNRAARKWKIFNPDLPVMLFSGPVIYWNTRLSPQTIALKANQIFLYIKHNTLHALFIDNNGRRATQNLSNLAIAAEILSAIEDECTYFSSWAQEYEFRRQLGLPICGIVVPFIEGVEINNTREMAEALLDFYRKTRQIIKDFNNEGNLLKERGTGLVRVVDFDMTIACHSPRQQCGFYQADDYAEIKSDVMRNPNIALGHRYNLILLYIEKHLKHLLWPLEVLNPYIKVPVIEALIAFEEKSIPITYDTLVFLLFLSEQYPEHRLLLSPECIQAMVDNISSLEIISALCDQLYVFCKTEGLMSKYQAFIEPQNFIPLIQYLGQTNYPSLVSAITEALDVKGEWTGENIGYDVSKYECSSLFLYKK